MVTSEVNLDTDAEVTLHKDDEDINKEIIISELGEASNAEVVTTMMSDDIDSDDMNNFSPEKGGERESYTITDYEK